MKIFNKFIWSKKEPSNKNDIWFDGSTWRMYTEEAWQSFTLPVDAADTVTKMLENASEVYQEKLNAGYGIIIEGNTISVDDSILYDDSDVWEAIETLQQNKVEQIQLNDYVPLDRYTSTAQVLMDNISELNSTKADKTKTEQELNKKLNKTDVATINGQSLIEGGNITIPTGGESYDDTEIKQQLTELSAEVSEVSAKIEDIVGVYKYEVPNPAYYQTIPIKQGEKFRLVLLDVQDEMLITFFAKTNTSDTSYQTLGVFQKGVPLEVIADRDINYLKAYNDSTSAFPVTFQIERSNANTEIDSLKVSVENLSSQLEDLSGSSSVEWGVNYYMQTPKLLKGKEYVIKLLSSKANRKITFFAKTKTEDGTYQLLGAISEGSLSFVADREINYIKAYCDYDDVYPIVTEFVSSKNIAYNIGTLEAELHEKTSPPKMYNPQIPWHKDSLNVLDIGNSYTGDCHTYLPGIIAASGAEVSLNLYKAIRSSGSFKTWVDCYNDRDGLTYSVSKTYGESLGIDGSGAANNGETFRKALAVKWDVILIHQVSNFATDFESWETQSESGYLKEFIQVLRKTNPQATIGFLMVHSYRSNYSQNTEKSSELRFAKIVDATKRIMREYGIDFVIPYGTAVQNLRASSLNDAYEFSEDGTHLGEGMGDYVAACCYYQSMIAPINGVSIMGNTFRVTGLTEGNGKKNVTDETAPIAQKAALLATCNMWEVVNPEDYDL